MQAILGIGLIIGVIYLICMFFAFVLIALNFILANFLALCDTFFSMGALYPPYLCWAASGFILGSILYFISHEAPVFRRPDIQFFLVVIVFFFLLFAPMGLKAISTLSPAQSVRFRPTLEQHSSRPQPIQPQQNERKTAK